MNKSFTTAAAAVCTKSFTTGRPTQRVTFTHKCWVLGPVPTHGRFRLLFQHRFSHAVVKNGALGVIFALGRASVSPRWMPLSGLPTPRLLLPDGSRKSTVPLRRGQEPSRAPCCLAGRGFPNPSDRQMPRIVNIPDPKTCREALSRAFLSWK